MSENGNGSFKFDRTITLGSLLQIITLLGALFGGYAAVDRRITVLETRLGVMEDLVKTSQTLMSTMNERLARLEGQESARILSNATK